MQFSTEELADPERALKRLILAAQDMAECAAAAEFLHTRGESGDVRRALETAVPVAYARPWGKANTIGALEDQWLPAGEEQLSLHGELIKVRNKVYAHTDEEITARGVEDVSEILGVPSPYFVPAWNPLNPDLHPAFAELENAQRARFVEGALALQARLSSVRG